VNKPQGQTALRGISEMTLNKAQHQAVYAAANSVLQILAGPGSGKTKVLTHRVSHLLDQGVPPENIILTTFTNVSIVVFLLICRKLRGT
jgi:ATP-dependent exoDNAse (exonuclease V) beta subunit